MIEWMNFPHTYWPRCGKMWVIVDVVVIAALMKDTEGCDHAPSGLPIPLHPGPSGITAKSAS